MLMTTMSPYPFFVMKIGASVALHSSEIRAVFFISRMGRMVGIRCSPFVDSTWPDYVTILNESQPRHDAQGRPLVRVVGVEIE